MRIKKVIIYQVNILLKFPFKIALGTTTVAENMFVKIETDQGIYGWGEGSPYSPVVGETQKSCITVARDIAKFLLGKDPLNIKQIVTSLERIFPFNPTTRSAFDMALYDILAKVANLPLYRLLGGQERELFTDYTIGLETPEEMAEKAEWAVSEGFSIIKIKLGTNIDVDMQRIRSVYNVTRDGILLRIDANQGWEKAEAVKFLKAVENMPIQFCEQPVPARDLAGMRYVRSKVLIPLVADEALFNTRDALTLFFNEICDYFNIKLAKTGGFTEAIKLVSLAETLNVPCMIGCMNETRLGLTAAAHLAMAFPFIRFIDLDSAFMHSTDPILGGIMYVKGRMLVPDNPGLGVDVDPEFVDKLEQVEVKEA
jgi:L-alanine-DL-glutamate epimerase-like enolase superfamily enzyme